MRFNWLPNYGALPLNPGNCGLEVRTFAAMRWKILKTRLRAIRPNRSRILRLSQVAVALRTQLALRRGKQRALRNRTGKHCKWHCKRIPLDPLEVLAALAALAGLAANSHPH